jgi:histone-binding protein RBBP4
VYITEQTGAHPGADANTILSYNVDVTKPRVAAAEHMLFDDGTDGGGFASAGANGIANGGENAGGGGPRVSNINLGFFKKVHAIIHPGEVNNMRSFGSLNPDVLVTHTDSEELYVWDVKRQPGRSFKECRVRNDDANYKPSTPDLILSGHTEFAEFALDCHAKEYKVASGGRDTNVLVWHLPDFSANAAVDSSNRNGKVTTSESGVEGVRLNAQCTFKGHTDTVEDVAFHPTDSNILCSVSDDTRLLFWDSRCDHGKPVNAVKASEVDVHVVDWNALNTNLIATGGKDKIVKVWDWRKIGEFSSPRKGGKKQQEGETASEKDMVIMSHSHEGEILRASWSPHDENVFASASDDGCLNVWDLSRKKGTNSSDEEATTTANDNDKPNTDGATAGAENDSGEGDDGNTNKPKKSRFGEAPPDELLFTHSGHRNPITDFQWNPHDPWTVVSSGSGANVASTCQFWRISDLITRPKEEVMQELEKHSAYICGRAAKPAESDDDTEDTGDDTSDAGDDPTNTKEEDFVKREEQNMTRNPSYETAQEEAFEAMDL